MASSVHQAYLTDSALALDCDTVEVTSRAPRVLGEYQEYLERMKYSPAYVPGASAQEVKCYLCGQFPGTCRGHSVQDMDQWEWQVASPDALVRIATRLLMCSYCDKPRGSCVCGVPCPCEHHERRLADVIARLKAALGTRSPFRPSEVFDRKAYYLLRSALHTPEGRKLWCD
jgi:hypothetical protein